MIKRLIEYLATERRTEYIQYESSSKSSNARDYTSYSTLKATRLEFRHEQRRVRKQKFKNVRKKIHELKNSKNISRFVVVTITFSQFKKMFLKSLTQVN